MEKIRCVRCNSHEGLTSHTVARKMTSRSQIVGPRRRRVTYQEFKFDFPICGVCSHKIKRLDKINLYTFLIFLVWVITFGGLGAYTLFQTNNKEQAILYFIIAVIGTVIIGIQKVLFHFSKSWPRRLMKIKIKFRGYDRGKNYEGIPMVKPLNSKKWINYDTWLKLNS